MFNRSVPPRFWLLVGCVLVPLINASNSLLISYFWERKFLSIDYFIGSFIVSYLFNLIVLFPLGLCSTMASEKWKIGFWREARILCCISGLIALFIFGYSLLFEITHNGTRVSNFAFLSQFPLPLIWSLGLILTGILLRTPRRN
jgi:hypothetical protein